MDEIDENCDVVEFGHGEILISLTHERFDERLSGVAFARIEPHPIGEWLEFPEGTTSRDVGAFLRFIFKNVKSLDVLIELLQELRQEMATND